MKRDFSVRQCGDICPMKCFGERKVLIPKRIIRIAAVSSRLQAIIDEGTSPLLDFIKKDKLTELLTENKSQPWYGQLMTTPQTIAYFIQFDYWLRKYKVRFA